MKKIVSVLNEGQVPSSDVVGKLCRLNIYCFFISFFFVKIFFKEILLWVKRLILNGVLFVL